MRWGAAAAVGAAAATEFHDEILISFKYLHIFITNKLMTRWGAAAAGSRNLPPPPPPTQGGPAPPGPPDAAATEFHDEILIDLTYFSDLSWKIVTRKLLQPAA